MKAKNTLFHINWGDNDEFFVIAPDEETAKERMPDGRDMVNSITRLDLLYQMIFKAGMKKVVGFLAIRWAGYEENAIEGTYRTTFKMSDKQWKSLKQGEIPK